MQTNFKIYAMGGLDERPPISHKLIDYFVQFVIDHVLKPQRIIIGGKWQTHLCLHFLAEGPRFTTSEIVMAKGATTVKQDSVKIYNIIIPTKAIVESQNPYQKTIDIMYEAITKYFTSSFKKVTLEFMADLRTQIDFDYLLSLPYPAPFAEQQFLLDQQLYIEEPNGFVRAKTAEEQAQLIGYKGKLS